MRLLEWQAKRLFKQFGIPVPDGMLLQTPNDCSTIDYPRVIKAQVPIGGRGKAGAIKLVNDAASAAAAFAEICEKTIKGFSCTEVLAETPVQADRELYLTILYDKETNSPVIIASTMGGVDIEQASREQPEMILKQKVDFFIGIQNFQIRSLSKKLGINDWKAFSKILLALYEIFQQFDASLVEINPLAVTSDGLIALDGKVELDEKARQRHTELFNSLAAEHSYIEKSDQTKSMELAKAYGVKFVQLEGNVGILSDGAGTGMLALDMITDEGGRPANFCELGGLATPATVKQSIEVILANPRVEVLFITFIGGMTRMDEMADGIVAYLEEKEMTVPFVIRMCGTKEKEGRDILSTVGLSAHYDIGSAVREAVSLVRK